MNPFLEDGENLFRLQCNDITGTISTNTLTAIHYALQDAWGNPSSSYSAGKKASHVIKQARSSVANMIGAYFRGVKRTS